MKLTWKVAEKEKGRYASFHKRGWPTASYPNGQPAVALYCESEYVPARVKLGLHERIQIRVARHVSKEQRAQYGAFKWVTLVVTAKTLDEAKKVAQETIDKHTHLWPEEYSSEA